MNSSERVYSVHLSASGKSSGDEVALVTRGCRFRGLYSTIRTRAGTGKEMKVQLLDGSGGSSLVDFNVVRPAETATVYRLIAQTSSVMVPDYCYVSFKSGLYIKAPSDADAFNVVAYTVFYS